MSFKRTAYAFNWTLYAFSDMKWVEAPASSNYEKYLPNFQ